MIQASKIEIKPIQNYPPSCKDLSDLNFTMSSQYLPSTAKIEISDIKIFNYDVDPILELYLHLHVVL